MFIVKTCKAFVTAEFHAVSLIKQFLIQLSSEAAYFLPMVSIISCLKHFLFNCFAGKYDLRMHWGH